MDRVLGQPDHPQQLPGAGLDLVAGHHVMHPQQLAQDAADGQPRVERRIRILENHLNPALIGAGPAAGGQHLAVQPDLAAVNALDAGDRPGERRLA